MAYCPETKSIVYAGHGKLWLLYLAMGQWRKAKNDLPRNHMGVTVFYDPPRKRVLLASVGPMVSGRPRPVASTACTRSTRRPKRSQSLPTVQRPCAGPGWHTTASGTCLWWLWRTRAKMWNSRRACSPTIPRRIRGRRSNRDTDGEGLDAALLRRGPRLPDRHGRDHVLCLLSRPCEVK
jgi:hypothetical protein